MEDLESLVLRPVEYPPPFTKIGPSYGGPRKFCLRRVEYPPRIETSHGGPRKFGFEATRIPPPLPTNTQWIGPSHEGPRK